MAACDDSLHAVEDGIPGVPLRNLRGGSRPMTKRDECLTWMLAIFVVAGIVGAAVWWSERGSVVVIIHAKGE